MLPNIFTPPFFRRLTDSNYKWLNYERSETVIGGANFLINMKLFRGMSEGAALAWLCSHIPPIKRLNSEEATQSLSIARLNMRSKSIKLLLESLANNPQSSPETLTAVRLHIRTLFEAECMAGDTAAAKAHINILFQLQDPVTDEIVRLQHLLVIMFNVTELACMKLERTVIPFGTWTSEQFTPLWTLSTPFIPVAPKEVTRAPPCVKLSIPHKAMETLKHCLWVGETKLPFSNIAEKFRADMTFAW